MTLCRPRCERIFPITSASVIAAIHLLLEPQIWHLSTSAENTRAISSDHEYLEHGRLALSELPNPLRSPALLGTISLRQEAPGASGVAEEWHGRSTGASQAVESGRQVVR